MQRCHEVSLLPEAPLDVAMAFMARHLEAAGALRAERDTSARAIIACRA